MSKCYTGVSIYPDPSGSGGYVSASDGGAVWTSAYALIREVERTLTGRTVYILGGDDLPRELPDIRGRIRGEPRYVLGWVDEDGVPRYMGIVEFDDGEEEVHT